MKKTGRFIFILSFSLLISSRIFPLDYTDLSSTLSDIFYNLTGENEGTTTFRSLLIPAGGRAESLGCAFTGLSDDVSYIDYNPAASSILKQTEIAFFHNSWIADSNMETIAATTRFGNLGVGGKISCFYLPFTEYNSFGERVAGSYYSETTGAVNIAYNIAPGYTFKGLAVGINGKVSWRQMPDYTDNDTNEIIQESGLKQSALAIMGDIGIMCQFNAAKFFNSRDANFRIGFSATNLGAALTGFGSNPELSADDPLPATFGVGISYRIIAPLTLTAEFRQPVNLFDMNEYQFFYAGLGASMNITSFFSVLAGFQLKGANPKFSLGGEFEYSKLRFNANYTLDLTSSFNPVNRISLQAKILLGDKGRKEKEDKVYELYNEGIYYFANKDYEKAVEKWKAALLIDRYFDPAKTGIKIASEYVTMLKEMGSISNTEK